MTREYSVIGKLHFIGKRHDLLSAFLCKVLQNAILKLRRYPPMMGINYKHHDIRLCVGIMVCFRQKEYSITLRSKSALDLIQTSN